MIETHSSHFLTAAGKLSLLPACLCLGLALATGSGQVDAGHKKKSQPCIQTAKTMLQSCFFEVHEEHRATLANCLNISDAETRTDCRKDAAEERREARTSCREQKEARVEVCDLLSEIRYDPDPLTGEALNGDPIVFVDPDDIGGTETPNPYFSLVPGRTQVLRAGEDFEETVVVYVTDQVREIMGVACRVVVDIVLLNEESEYVAIEVTDDWYAQSTERDVYYCGELAREFEDGILRELSGSFEAGLYPDEYAKSGILIKANPSVGDAHRQEFALGEAEDVVRYVDSMAIPTTEEGGENAAFPCAPAGCVKTEEFVPPSPEAGEFKYYLENIGFVLGVELEDDEITGIRDELVCVGDSLDILSDPNSGCGISDPAQLLETLCKLSPDAFCPEN